MSCLLFDAGTRAMCGFSFRTRCRRTDVRGRDGRANFDPLAGRFIVGDRVRAVPGGACHLAWRGRIRPDGLKTARTTAKVRAHSDTAGGKNNLDTRSAAGLPVSSSRP